jgi:4-diphosphocytidyl-2-C-methyl-D-erythritol kinase
MSGIGDILSPVPHLPQVHAVLVNPGCGISTPAVFDALAIRENPPMGAIPDNFEDGRALVSWLADQRNDLEGPARQLAPAIGTVLAVLSRRQGCLLARMSGSGATCFGLFPEAPAASAAARSIGARHPDWWVVPTVLG